MSPSSFSAPLPEAPLWEAARDLYDNVRDRVQRSRDPDHAELFDLTNRLEVLAQRLLGSLRQPTKGIVTQAGLLVSASDRSAAEEVDMLNVGDVRLVGDRFLCTGHRPLPLLLLEQNFDTDEWLVVPFGEGVTAVRDHEWETDLEVPLQHVLCFWNAHWIKGAALDDAALIDEFGSDELEHMIELHAAMKANKPWAEDDLARSGSAITSVLDDRHDYVERELELMRELTRIKTFRASGTGDAFNLTASSGSAVAHQQGYMMVGFARELWLRSLPGREVAVQLSGQLGDHAAPMPQPVLVTWSGNEYKLAECEAVRVPLPDIEQGFCVRIGDYGKALLVELPA